jgi:hypothetical protein
MTCKTTKAQLDAQVSWALEKEEEHIR